MAPAGGLAVGERDLHKAVRVPRIIVLVRRIGQAKAVFVQHDHVVVVAVDQPADGGAAAGKIGDPFAGLVAVVRIPDASIDHRRPQGRVEGDRDLACQHVRGAGGALVKRYSVSGIGDVSELDVVGIDVDDDVLVAFGEPAD